MDKSAPVSDLQLANTTVKALILHVHSNSKLLCRFQKGINAPYYRCWRLSLNFLEVCVLTTPAERGRKSAGNSSGNWSLFPECRRLMCWLNGGLVYGCVELDPPMDTGVALGSCPLVRMPTNEGLQQSVVVLL